MRANVVELSQTDDQKSYILGKLKSVLKGHTVLGDRVLVATYIRPEKTKGGVYIPNNSVDESRFQGKVGLVVAMGDAAFKNEGYPYFHPYEGPKPEIGDWVQYYPSDAREFFMGGNKDSGGICCRKIPSSLISGILDDPDTIY